MTEKRETTFDRRTALKTLGGVGVLAGVGGTATGQETGGEPSDGGQSDGGQSVRGTPILLVGEIEHWYGLAPSQIHGEENPTLSLRPGQQYTLVWMNVDGKEHELIIEDPDGNEITATESTSTPGATRQATFTAAERMSQYYCEYHPQRMRGDVSVGNS
ncbi:plastocyanin/azurin family copper-binding protein [Haladaptatus pallidirubidus]|uniref:Blue (type 1) copper domain-containing protein n=1 Tax=Haladaptatus pallidirubidus TaxID=1008152 RepID=A0AAV3UN33_9EURY|nr:plastocyanin/azurin family copper-binding protein [Haladaptatus pallidirubidus]